MIQFITENTALVGLITISFTGLFALIKWFDTRKRELADKRYNTYMDLIGVIAGKRKDSSTPNFTEQVAATWFLVEYKEYYHITKRIFADSNMEKMSTNQWVSIVGSHVKKMLIEISK